MVKRSEGLKSNLEMVPYFFIISVLVSLSACGHERAPSPAPVASGASVLARSPGFRDATDFYGPLWIKAGEYEAEASVKPWSSWWFPIREKYLFEGKRRGDSPLEKYDLYSKEIFSREGKAAKYEKEKIFDQSAGPWEGLCNAWSAASLMAPEPDHSRTLGGIAFGVGDLKALLVKSFEHVQGLRQFGQRFNGDRAGVFEDIYPEQFHQVLQAELFGKRRPLILDKDPGIAVWNTPIWKAQLKILQDETNPHVMHVTAWIFGASPFVESYDFVGTLPVVMQYFYDLHGELLPDGSMRVDSGEWTGDSRDYHPDFVTVLPETAVHESVNPEIQGEVLDAIFSGRDF